MTNKLGWIGLAALGLCGACASQDKAPAASPNTSAANVDAATNNPNTGPNFAPARADGTASAIAPTATDTPPGTNPAPGTSDTVVDRDRSMPSSSRNARSTTGSNSPSTDTTASSDTNSGYAASSYPNDRTNNNSGSNGSAGPSATSKATDTSAPDNTRVNKRDRNDATVLPTDQGNNEADLKTTQAIRQALMKDKNLSFGAKNVKIITQNGKVTLRGPVSSEAERATIEAAARKVAGVTQVDNQLELKNNERK